MAIRAAGQRSIEGLHVGGSWQGVFFEVRNVNRTIIRDVETRELSHGQREGLGDYAWVFLLTTAAMVEAIWSKSNGPAPMIPARRRQRSIYY